MSMSFGRGFKRLLSVVFIEDIPLKIVCLILAVLFWFYIDGELTDEREVPVRILASDLPLPSGMEVLSERELPEVTVRVRGPRRSLQYFSARDIEMDLHEALPVPVRGPQTIALRRSFFSGQGVDVVSVSPGEFTLVLTKTVRRMLPVQAATAGDVPPGYRLVEALVEPREVTVESKEDIDSAEKIWTEPIAVKERTAPFKVSVALARVVQAGEREVSVSCDEKVSVTLKIVREEIQRVLEGVSVRALTPPGTALAVDPGTINVLVRGAQEDVAPLRNTDIQAYVEWPADWSLQGPSGKTFPARPVQVKVITPPRLKVMGEQDPALPTVKVQGKLVQSSAGW